MGARSLIRSLEIEEKEDGEKLDEGLKKKVIELSVQSAVSSAYTAFIAVNKGNRETIQGPLVRRNVPAPSECIFQQQINIQETFSSTTICMLLHAVLDHEAFTAEYNKTHT